MTIFFDVQVSVRLKQEERDRIRHVVNLKDERYENEVHFIRCAVMKLLRAEEEEG